MQTKATGEAPAGAKPPKPSSRPASAGAAATAAAAAALPTGAAPSFAANGGGPTSPQAAPGTHTAQAAAGPQQHVALTPEEDKIPLAMMAGVTPAKAPRVPTRFALSTCS